LKPSLHARASDVHFLIAMNLQSGQALVQRTLREKVLLLTSFLRQQDQEGRAAPVD
jgi:hypothetical protein